MLGFSAISELPISALVEAESGADFNGTASVTTGGASCSASGTHEAPTFSATASVTTGGATVAASDATGERTATAAVTTGGATVSASGTAVIAVEWAWVGAVTPDGATVVTRLAGPGDARLAVSTSSDLSSPTFSSAVTADADDVARLPITGLSANTLYYWGVEHDGVIDDVNTGKFTTFPTSGTAHSFTVAAASCVGGDASQSDFSNSVAFDNLRDLDPLMFLHMGDFHYRDLVETLDTQAEFEAAIEGQLLQAKQAQCWREVPISYVWSQHDFGTGARASYEHYVPHYTLPDEDAVYHTWVIGRVRFIMLDIDASASTPTTLLGATQKTWFKNLLLSATEPAIVVSVSQEWSGTHSSLTWGGAEAERQELCEFFEDNDLTRRIILIGGDLHAVAIDNGDNNQFDPDATTPGPPIYILAALTGLSGTQQGEYSYGTSQAIFGSVGQFGTLEFTDDGTDIVVTGTCITASDGSTRENVFRHSITVFGDGSSAATRTLTVGATGRDYASVSAAITAIKAKSIGNAGDTLIFECHADADFDEAVTYDPDPGWYRSVTFRPASGQSPKILRTGAGTVWDVRHGNLTVEGIEIDCNDQLTGNQRVFDFASQTGWVSSMMAGGGKVTLNRLRVHGLSGTGGDRHFLIQTVTSHVQLSNSVLYGFAMTASTSGTQSAVRITAGSAIFDCFNVTLDDMSLSGGDGDVIGFNITSNNTLKTIKNTVVTRVTTGGGGTTSCFALSANNVRNNNASDDTTADGTGSLTEITYSDQYVDADNADYRVLATADILDAGATLTEPDGVWLDLVGTDRQVSSGAGWDIGAMEHGVYSAPLSATTGGAGCSASGTFQSQDVSATASPTVGGAEVAASGAFASGIFTASAAVEVGGAAVAASGTHVAPSFTATVNATVGGATATISGTFSETDLTITSADNATATVGTAFSFTPTAVGGTEPYQWSESGLPAWLSINISTGEITGTPDDDDKGTSEFTFSVTDALGARDTQEFTLSVVAAPVEGPGCWADGAVYLPGWQEGDVYHPGFQDGVEAKC